MIVSKQSNAGTFNKDTPQNWVNGADTDLKNITTAMQGRLSFGPNTAASPMGQNIAGQFVTFTTPATPNTTFTVPHNLGSVPTGHIVASKNASVDVYGEPSTWSSTSITLKATTASTNVTLFLMK